MGMIGIAIMMVTIAVLETTTIRIVSPLGRGTLRVVGPTTGVLPGSHVPPADRDSGACRDGHRKVFQTTWSKFALV